MAVLLGAYNLAAEPEKTCCNQSWFCMPTGTSYLSESESMRFCHGSSGSFSLVEAAHSVNDWIWPNAPASVKSEESLEPRPKSLTYGRGLCMSSHTAMRSQMSSGVPATFDRADQVRKLEVGELSTTARTSSLARRQSSTWCDHLTIRHEKPPTQHTIACSVANDQYTAGLTYSSATTQANHMKDRPPGSRAAPAKMSSRTKGKTYRSIKTEPCPVCERKYTGRNSLLNHLRTRCLSAMTRRERSKLMRQIAKEGRGEASLPVCQAPGCKLEGRNTYLAPCRSSSNDALAAPKAELTVCQSSMPPPEKTSRPVPNQVGTQPSRSSIAPCDALSVLTALSQPCHDCKPDGLALEIGFNWWAAGRQKAQNKAQSTYDKSVQTNQHRVASEIAEGESKGVAAREPVYVDTRECAGAPSIEEGMTQLAAVMSLFQSQQKALHERTRYDSCAANERDLLAACSPSSQWGRDWIVTMPQVGMALEAIGPAGLVIDGYTANDYKAH